MNEAITAIALADDFSIVRAFEFFHEQLSDALEAPVADLEAAITGAKGSSLLALVRANEDVPLPAAGSVEIARWLLVTAAQSETFAPVVLRSVQDWPDKTKSVGEILTVGMLGITWLIVATTEVSVKNGKVEVHKVAIDVGAIDVSAGNAQTKFEIHIRDKGARPPEGDGTAKK